MRLRFVRADSDTTVIREFSRLTSLTVAAVDLRRHAIFISSATLPDDIMTFPARGTHA